MMTSFSVRSVIMYVQYIDWLEFLYLFMLVFTTRVQNRHSTNKAPYTGDQLK